jgi:CRISPR type I-F-associated protein Csy2
VKSYVTATIRVLKANMQQTHYLIAPTPIFASVMAAHAFGMNLTAPVHVERVGIVLHNARPWVEIMETKEGYENLELVQRRGIVTFDGFRSDREIGALSMQPGALCDYELSLILECDQAVDLQQLRQIISTSRLAGGVIAQVQSLTEAQSLNDAITKIQSGFWVEDATDLLEQKMEETRDPMRALLLAPQGQPWVIPATLGYSMLEAFGPREGTRHDPRRGHDEVLDHAFAEAMVGLVRYRSLRHIREQIAVEEDAVEPQMWFSAWHDDEFTVQTTRQTWVKPAEVAPEDPAASVPTPEAA